MDTAQYDNQIEFSGFEEIESNFIQFPKQWTNIMASIDNLAELKVVEYVIRHTWGYNGIENRTKKITVDEFVNGRKDKQRNRIDNGTGLSESSVKMGIKKAIEHGFLKMEVDDRDKARVKRYFTLYTQVQRNKDILAPFIIQLILVFSFLHDNIDFWLVDEVQSEEKLGGQDLTPRGLESDPRSGIETINKNLNSNYSNIKIEREKERIIVINQRTSSNQNESKPKRGRSDLISMAQILAKNFKLPTESESKKVEKPTEITPNHKKNNKKASRKLIYLTQILCTEFGDSQHLASNIQQMKNILFVLESRGVSEDSFVDFAYGVKGLVKENINNIHGSKMGYYFKALRINLKI